MQNIGIFIKYEREQQGLDQKVLCDGICSNSYLSKIENNEVVPNIEIIKLLCQQLDYDFILEDKNFEQFNDKLWTKIINFEDVSDDEVIASEYIKRLKFSKYSTDIYFLKNLLRYKNSEYSKILNEDFKDLNLTERLKYRCDILCALKSLNMDEIITLSYTDNIGLVTYLQSLKAQVNGKYNLAIDLAKEAFKLFALNGNIQGLIHASFIEANSSSNLNDIDSQIKISQRIINLNRTLNDHIHNFNVHYNLGSAYTVRKDYDLANKYLTACLDIPLNDSEGLIYVYEKLLLNAIFEKDYRNYDNYLEQLEVDSNIWILFNTLKTNDFNLKHKLVIEALERCFDLEGRMHHGRRLLFGSLLYDAYRSTYQYPKALKLLESLNSAGFELFFVND